MAASCRSTATISKSILKKPARKNYWRITSRRPDWLTNSPSRLTNSPVAVNKLPLHAHKLRLRIDKLVGKNRQTQPWRALKRGFFLLITYTRPLRRTTRQSLSRFLADFKELKTFMAVFPVQMRRPFTPEAPGLSTAFRGTINILPKQDCFATFLGMQIHDCPIAGLKTIQLKILGDSRGFFVERFHAQRFADAGLPTEFTQDNHSRSAPGILRGLHYQHTPPQGKLVGVIRGRVWDVAVDIRPQSPTFGQHHAVELSGDNGLLFWMPPGFAHGFCVLGDEPADMYYKVTGLYNAPGEGGIAYNDPDLNIPWPIENPTISARDLSQQSWRDYCSQPPSWEKL